MPRWLNLLICTFCLTANLFLAAEEPDPSKLVTVELIQEEQTIQPGRPFWVAVHLNIADKWHSYWKNPGDVGMATSIEWELPPGFVASPMAWPTPERFTVDSIVGFGYEGEISFLVQIMPPSKQLADAKLKAKVHWLVCSDSTCIPGETEAETQLAMSDAVPAINTSAMDLFAKARARLPNKHRIVKASYQKDKITLPLELPKGIEVKTAHFYPENEELIDYHGDVSIGTEGESHALTLKPAAQFVAASAEQKVLRGVVVAVDQKGLHHSYELEAPFLPSESDELISLAEPQATAAQAAANSDAIDSLWVALAFAFVGGMILNLMPCVLPVMSFKILSFVKMAGKSRGLVLQHGVAFSLGVLASFWTLAGALLVLQAYGNSVGWGFQLQEPFFVGILAAVLLILSLSLFGLFELGTSVTSLAGKVQPKEGLSGSFIGGVLATAVATPCTGPFLGSAVGFAFAAPAWAAILVFTSLGLGMAFPYLLLSGFPQLLRFIPKPGPWMVTFKEMMGFLMMASVLWLVWVFGAQTNELALSILLGSFLVISLGCWIYGKWGSPVSSKRSRLISKLLVAACLVAGIYGVNTSTQPWVAMVAGREAIAGPAHGDWEPFSPERIAELQKKGVPVLVDFTAKWCLICQVNHLVLTEDSVDSKLADLGVVKMKADWTKNDPVITAELRKQGRNGVPLYLLYTGEKDEQPQILPQVLTPDIVLQYLKTLE